MPYFLTMLVAARYPKQTFMLLGASFAAFCLAFG